MSKPELHGGILVAGWNVRNRGGARFSHRRTVPVISNSIHGSPPSGAEVYDLAVLQRALSQVSMFDQMAEKALLGSYTPDRDVDEDTAPQAAVRGRCSLHRRHSMLANIDGVLRGLNAITLLAILILLAVNLPSTRWKAAPPQCPGSDFNGFVPAEITSNTRRVPSGPDKYQLPTDAFENMAALNRTLQQWKSLSRAGFVRAVPYDGRGPQEPLPGNIFEISVFHQMHCLARILEDFALLASGIAVADLPSFSEGMLQTWSEHQAHCFNYVRSALMCFADATTEGRHPDYEHRVADSGVIHVCNDFDGLLRWSMEDDRRLPDSLIVTE